VTIANQQPIKGSPKAEAMEPGKGSETKRSFSGNGEDDIVRRMRQTTGPTQRKSDI